MPSKAALDKSPDGHLKENQEREENEDKHWLKMPTDFPKPFFLGSGPEGAYDLWYQTWKI